jgi:hypothetical protein
MTERSLWQATIYRPNDRAADTIKEAREVLAILGPEWHVEEAEDAEMGIWLIGVPQDIEKRLNSGKDYSRQIKGGWRLEIDQP